LSSFSLHCEASDAFFRSSTLSGSRSKPFASKCPSAFSTKADAHSLIAVSHLFLTFRTFPISHKYYSLHKGALCQRNASRNLKTESSVSHQGLPFTVVMQRQQWTKKNFLCPTSSSPQAPTTDTAAKLSQIFAYYDKSAPFRCSEGNVDFCFHSAGKLNYRKCLEDRRGEAGEVA